MNRKSLLAFMLVALVPRAFSQVLPELGDASSAEFSPQMEKRVGEEAYRSIRFQEGNFVDDPEVSAYINGLGRKLVAASSDRNKDFEFFAVQDSTINAFAMPGGYVGMNTGLLLAAQSESEVASVLAHEISHVTQKHIARSIGKQSDLTTISIAAMVLALLASRSGGDLSTLAVAGASAGAIQAQLNYSRDFEREADRVGFQLLTDAGFDGHAMATFFGRLQSSGRLGDNNAPAYLRTHPMSGERMSDIQNRAQFLPYKQIPDSLDFQLVRAKLRAAIGDPRETVVAATEQLRQKRYASEAAARYFLTSALLRNKDLAGADRELANLRSLKLANPMIDLLAARIQIAQNRQAVAQTTLRDSLARTPSYLPLRYALVQLLQDAGQHALALQESEDLVKLAGKDADVYAMRARSFAATGQQVRMHQALAEQYYLMGALPGAVEQLQMAQKAGGTDFFQSSVIDARLREIQKEQLPAGKPR